MRIVDEETRKIVMENRLEALENDRLFEKFKAQDDLMIPDVENSKDEAAEFIPSDLDAGSSDSQPEADADEQKMFGKQKPKQVAKGDKRKTRQVIQKPPKLTSKFAMSKHSSKRQPCDLARLFE